MAQSTLNFLKTLPDKDIIDLLMDLYEDQVIPNHQHQYNRDELVLSRDVDGYGKMEIENKEFRTLVMALQHKQEMFLYLRRTDGGTQMITEEDDMYDHIANLKTKIRKIKISQALK